MTEQSHLRFQKIQPKDYEDLFYLADQIAAELEMVHVLAMEDEACSEENRYMIVSSLGVELLRRWRRYVPIEYEEQS